MRTREVELMLVWEGAWCAPRLPPSPAASQRLHRRARADEHVQAGGGHFSATPHSLFTVVSLATPPGEEPVHAVRRGSGTTGVLSFGVVSETMGGGGGGGGGEWGVEGVVGKGDLIVPDAWVCPALLVVDVEVWGGGWGSGPRALRAAAPPPAEHFP